MKSIYIIIICFFISNCIFAQGQDTIKMGNSTIIFENRQEAVEKKIEKKEAQDKPVEKIESTLKVEDIKTEFIENKEIFLEEKRNIEKQPSQNTPRKERYREVSMNVTSLLSRITPFGDALPMAGPTTIYLKKYTGNKAFRFGLGLQSSPDAALKNAIFRIGVERRKALNVKWSFTRSTDFMWAFGSFDTPGFFPGDGTGTGITPAKTIGVGIAYGVAYNINKFISIGTESTVFLGLGGNGSNNDSIFNFKIIPPVAIYISAKLY